MKEGWRCGGGVDFIEGFLWEWVRACPGGKGLMVVTAADPIQASVIRRKQALGANRQLFGAQ